MLMKIIGDILVVLPFLAITIAVGLIVLGLAILNSHFMGDDDAS